MKNKLINLNDHLFQQLEKLNDDELTGEQLQQEIARANAITGIAKQILNTGRLALDAKKAVLNGMIREDDVPEVLSLENRPAQKGLN